MPRLANELGATTDGGALDPSATRPSATEIDALLATPSPQDWSAPEQTPTLQPEITGGDASLVGTWIEEACDPANAPRVPPWGCVRVTFGLSPEGSVEGTLQIDRTGEVPGVPGVPLALAPFPPAQDPDVGYPPGVDPREYQDLLSNFPAGIPYRVLDGRFVDHELTFAWSLMDIWHGWCALQTSHPWMIGDHAFAFCVPQDREQWSSIDAAKIVLCVSADFEPLCAGPSGDVVPCPCTAGDGDPRCSVAYCKCDDAGCDADVHFQLMQARFTVESDHMVGAWSGPADSWVGTLRRSTP